MNRSMRVVAVLAIVLTMAGGFGCSKLRARDQLNKGVQSFKNSRFEEAIGHFQKAADLDPNLLNARIYLARAYALQYIPGAEKEENTRMASSAIEEYKKVLSRAPNNAYALKEIASLYLQMKRYDDSKQYFEKAAEVDPKDAENYYSIAVIDWWQAHEFRQQERNKLGMKPTDQLKDKKTCSLVKQRNQPTVEDGIHQLQKALQITPDYEDAMGYMNLLYRERADYECDDANARAADTSAAEAWFEKTMATKRAKAEKEGPAGIVLGK